MSNLGGGVIRPYTLLDILNTINGTAIAATQLNGGVPVNVIVGIIGEADETVPTTDTAFGASFTNYAWDQGLWNDFAWG